MRTITEHHFTMLVCEDRSSGYAPLINLDIVTGVGDYGTTGESIRRERNAFVDEYV